MVACVIVDDGHSFETIMKRDEGGGGQNPNFFLSQDQEQYLNKMLIRGDEI